MARKSETSDLARRERQIMEAIHRLGEASVGEVLAEIADPPSYSSVRTMIRHLEAKRLLRHRQDGRRYVYRATQSRAVASRSALRKLIDVFFAGSASDTVAAILDVSGDKLAPEDLARMADMIQQARSEGK